MSHFCLTLKLETERYQEDILKKRFEIARNIYNSLVTVTQKRFKEMVKTKKYRRIKSELKDLYGATDKIKRKRQKEWYKQLNDMYKEYRINEYSFHADVQQMQKHFKNDIDSFTAQKIGTNLWKAYKKRLSGEGKNIHYKKFDTLFSVEGKSNQTGIRFKEGMLLWNGLNIPVKIDANNAYEDQAMQHEMAYCRIIRKFVREKYKYYLQIVFKGNVPVKINKETGEDKRTTGKGKVGIDIGTQTIAISSHNDVKLLELADRVQNIENQKRKLLRYMDRSKRMSNPDHFHLDGTIKNGIRLHWLFSNRYVKARRKLKELYRKQADIRKLQHEIMANDVIRLGNEFYVEKMNFKGLQARNKKTEKNDKGKFKRKKRFGKSLANKAPAMLLIIINRKLSYHGLKLNKIHTSKVKASQYNHMDQECTKKKLSQRWNDLRGINIHRDLYSAFLIMNVNEDLESINQQSCHQAFDHFIDLHNEELKRLHSKPLTVALRNVI